MQRIFNPIVVLFGLLIIYQLQGFVYAQGSIISQSSLFVYYLISGVYFVKVLLLKGKKELFLKAWTMLLLANIISYILTGNYSRDIGLIKGVLMSLLSFYPFYYLTLKGTFRSDHIVKLLFIMIPVSIASYYFNIQTILNDLSYETTDIVNNVSYQFVNLIPFVFFIRRNRVVSILSMLIIIFFIIQGAKRGAIVVGIVGLIMYIYYQMRTIDKEYKIRGYILISVVILLISYFTYDMFVANELLLRRLDQMAEGNLSGRDTIYSNIFNGWLNSDSFFKLLFGYGFSASLNLSGTGNFAHNDWLELLSNLGLFGVSIYFVLFFSATKLMNSKNWNTDDKLIFITIVGMWFTTTIFSMVYTSMWNYSNAMLIGYFLANRRVGMDKIKQQ